MPPIRQPGSQNARGVKMAGEGRLNDRAVKMAGEERQNARGSVNMTGRKGGGKRRRLRQNARGGVKTRSRFMAFRGRKSRFQKRAIIAVRGRDALSTARFMQFRGRNVLLKVRLRLCKTRARHATASPHKALVSSPGCNLQKKTGRKTIIVYPRNILQSCDGLP